MRCRANRETSWFPARLLTGQPQRFFALQRISCPARRVSPPIRLWPIWTGTSAPRTLLAVKYYYQHDPSSSPYAYSNVPGFTAHMDTGSQVASINNVQTIGSTLSISETVGILREKAYATNDQPFGPQPTWA